MAKGHYPCPLWSNRQTFTINLIKLWDTYELRRKLLRMSKMKDLTWTLCLTLKFVVSCDVLGLEENFQRTCFGHAFIKTCQYATIDEFFCKCLRFISIKAL
jgi:hypothetical protein